MRVLLAGLALLFMGACTTPDQRASSDYQPIRFEGQKATSAERAKCEAVGGEVIRTGRLGAEHCVQKLADAGKLCSDEADCLGRCIIPPQEGREYSAGDAVNGICEATDDVFGCTTLVRGGKVEGTLCVD